MNTDEPNTTRAKTVTRRTPAAKTAAILLATCTALSIALALALAGALPASWAETDGETAGVPAVAEGGGGAAPAILLADRCVLFEVPGQESTRRADDPQETFGAGEGCPDTVEGSVTEAQEEAAMLSGDEVADEAIAAGAPPGEAMSATPPASPAEEPGTRGTSEALRSEAREAIGGVVADGCTGMLDPTSPAGARQPAAAREAAKVKHLDRDAAQNGADVLRIDGTLTEEGEVEATRTKLLPDASKAVAQETLAPVDARDGLDADECVLLTDALAGPQEEEEDSAGAPPSAVAIVQYGEEAAWGR